MCIRDSYQRILTEEVLYAREFSCEAERSAAIAVWNIHERSASMRPNPNHHNYHRPHSAADGQPPATQLKTGVTNVQPSYT